MLWRIPALPSHLPQIGKEVQQGVSGSMQWTAQKVDPTTGYPVANCEDMQLPLKAILQFFEALLLLLYGAAAGSLQTVQLL